jgi:cytosine/adenosine deaminase-related metal-dependent hydrolase
MLDPSPITTLRARYVFPIVGPPLANATVTITGPVIAAVGKSGDGGAIDSGRVVDLGSAAILPGLVNAHTHLEFSDLAAPLGRPGMPFPDWIRAVVAHRRSRTDADRREAIRQGLEESGRAGVAALGEIATVGWPADLFSGESQHTHQPATTVFLELLGLSIERTAANIAAAVEHLKRSDTVGLSPHAPYTVRPELVQNAAAMSRSARVPLAMHLAESPEEMQLLQTGGGPLVDLLSEFGVWDPTAIPLGARPLDYLRLLAEADRSLVIHGTYLDDEEIAFLAANAEHMAVVYCPRTHAYFPHAPYPLAKLLAAGVTVALGTDSRASNPDLRLFDELRYAAAHHAIAPDQLVALATLGGARALGRDRESGTLAPGKSADLTVVRLPNVEADPYELLFDPRSAIIATVRAGALIAGPVAHEDSHAETRRRGESE